MCVCLFSALSRMVGALQISIIIIIKEDGGWLDEEVGGRTATVWNKNDC